LRKRKSPLSSIATWYVIQGSADVRWRAEMPAKHLQARLCVLDEETAKSELTTPNGKKFRWIETDSGSEYPDHEGVAVWTRPCMVRAMHGASMSASGIRVVAEVDDNYLTDKKQNIFMRMNDYGPKQRESHIKAFATMDGIICSTDELRDEYSRTFKKEIGYVPDMFVARNHIDLDDWNDRVPMLPPNKEGRLRVGWAGSHQHVWDLRLAAPALRLAKDMGCEIVLVGLDPAMHDPKWTEFLGEYTHIPWSDPKKYHRSKLPFDIGLIPLVYNKHTLGKSDVKFLEYSMSGIATVAQSHPIYNRTIKHGETGLLASSPDGLAMEMARLIRSSRLRSELVESARQYVLENRTIQKNIGEWKEAILG
jgi:glycosyltransferase involved in cell wall biosynthesis